MIHLSLPGCRNVDLYSSAIVQTRYEQESEDETCDKATDVCLNSNGTSRQKSIHKVEAEPENPVADGSSSIDAECASVDDEEDTESSKDAEDCSRCAQSIWAELMQAIHIVGKVGKSTQNAGHEVNDEVSPLPIENFYAAPDEVEREHIEADVKDAGVQKHGGEDAPVFTIQNCAVILYASGYDVRIEQ